MSLATLTTYGKTLVSAGFEVWLTPTGYRDGGYLTYRAPSGHWGTLQHSDFEGWRHLMPLKPSREFGSHMFLDTIIDPFTVDAAKECAQAVNQNSIVGWQANARIAYLSPSAITL